MEQQKVTIKPSLNKIPTEHQYVERSVFMRKKYLKNLDF